MKKMKNSLISLSVCFWKYLIELIKNIEQPEVLNVRMVKEGDEEVEGEEDEEDEERSMKDNRKDDGDDTLERNNPKRLRKLNSSFFDYVNSYRIEHSKQLISENKLPIIEVAFASGFNAKSSFYKAFKMKTGQTPKQFAASAPAIGRE